MAKCVAIAEYGRINLIIRKDEEGYEEFAKVIKSVNNDGIFSWYGDVNDENGKEQCGLIITSKEKVNDPQ